MPAIKTYSKTMLNANLFSSRTIKSITGLTLSEFESLASTFHKAWLAAEKARPVLRTSERRVRALGAGRQAVLRSSRDKLLFILLWFKVYPTFDVMAFFFGMG